MKKFINTLFLLVLFSILGFNLLCHEYYLPIRPEFPQICDIDNDLDLDIIVGHRNSFNTELVSLSIVLNDGMGNFTLADTLTANFGYLYTNIGYLDDNNFLDIIASTRWDHPDSLYSSYIAIIYNYGFEGIENIVLYPLQSPNGLSDLACEDIDNDGDDDILFVSIYSEDWGILWNEGNGQFSDPVSYDLEDIYLNNIQADNLNEDDFKDVVVGGPGLHIYYSYPPDFQLVQLDNGGSYISLNDFDSDGDIDIVGQYDLLVSNSSMIIIYENIGNSSFIIHQNLIAGIYGGITVNCFNDDQFPDIICTRYDFTRLYLNEGNDNIVESTIIPITYHNEFRRVISSGDLDNDGNIDLIVIRSGIYDYPKLSIWFSDGSGNFFEEQQSSSEDDIVDLEFDFDIYPNPINNSTFLEFELDNPSIVLVSVYNLKGQKVFDLIESNFNKGNHKLSFNNTDLKDMKSSGIYFFRLTTNYGSLSKKVVILK